MGLGVSLWSANAAMKSLFDTLNIVYGEEEKRGFVKLNAISLLFTVGGILFVVAALGAIVVIPVALKYIGLSEAADLLLRLGRWPAMFVVLTLALAVIYRYGLAAEYRSGPSCRGARRGSPGTRPSVPLFAQGRWPDRPIAIACHGRQSSARPKSRGASVRPSLR